MSEDLVRVGAGVAALAVVASPYLVAALQQAAAWAKLALARKAKPAAAAGIGVEEMRIVLDLANRLRLDGNAEGVSLCQQLLDVMLKPQVARK